MKINVSETTKKELEKYEYKVADHGTIDVKVSVNVMIEAESNPHLLPQ